MMRFLGAGVMVACCCFLYFSGAGCIANDEMSEVRKKELLAIIDSGKFPPRNSLLPGEVEWISECVARARVSTGYPNYCKLLVYIGDEVEIKRVMSDYPRLPIEAHSVSSIGQPLIIEYIAPTLFLDEPARYAVQGDVTGAGPPSTTAAGRILDTLSAAPEVPAEVRLWAADTAWKMDHNGPPQFNDFRASLRTWWKVNEAAVKDRNWAGLKPGHRFADIPRMAPSVVTVPQPPAEPKKSPAGQAIPTTAAAAESQNGWAFYTAIGLGLFFLIAVSVYRNRA